LSGDARFILRAASRDLVNEKLHSYPLARPLDDLARAVAAYLYPDRRGRMVQYLDVTRLRTFGGEGVLAKLLRVEDRVMERTAAKLAAWAAVRPPAAEMGEFEESVAAEAYETLKKEFAVLLDRVPPAR